MAKTTSFFQFVFIILLHLILKLIIMSFDGTEGTFISLSDGAELTGKFRDTYPSQRKAIFFGKDKLQTLIDQTDAMGIRIYFGMDTDGKMELVLVAADGNENDILERILDCGLSCPTHCSSSNDLNS